MHALIVVPAALPARQPTAPGADAMADYRTRHADEDLWVPADSLSKQQEDIVLSYFDDGEPPPTRAASCMRYVGLSTRRYEASRSRRRPCGSPSPRIWVQCGDCPVV